MIIACGVLSCVAVLLGIIILEIAIDKKRTSSAKKQADELAKVDEPIKAEEQTSQASPVVKQTEEPVQAEEQTSQASPDGTPAKEPVQTEEQTSSDETPAEEPIQTEDPIIAEEPETEEELIVDDEPIGVVEPASEPIIEEAPVHAEPVHVVETIIADEPVEVIEHEEADEPVVTDEPAQTDEPIIAEEPAPVEEPEITEEDDTAELNEVEDLAPEVVEEPAPVEEPEITEEDDAAEFNGVEDPDDEVASELKVVVKDGQTRYIVIKYSKSFEAKLIQGTDDAKRYYSELKNCLLSYGVKSNMVKSRMSWKWEAFRYGRKTLARLRLRGKTVSVVLALNPDDYKDTKYLVESVADIACYADTPALCRIKSERRLKYTKELIAKMMQDNGLTQKPDFVPVDYAPQYPYDTTENLIERKLIKVLTDEDAQSGEVFKPSDIRKSVKAQDVDNILQDEIAAELIEKLDGVSDRTKSSIINIDTLSQNFRDGETVTIEEIRKRIKGYNKVTYIKVLARGTLDKRLTVEADDFSLQAVKMIALLGGKIIKK